MTAKKTPNGMTRTQYARHRRCAPKHVRNALESGKITFEVDGKIDPVKADADWLAATNPASATKPKPFASDPLATEDAGIAAAELLRLAGERVRAGGRMTFAEARTVNEVVKAQRAQLKLQRERFDAVDRREASNVFFTSPRASAIRWRRCPRE